MFVPLAIVVVYMTTIYPDEGGLYVWSKRVFGRFAGFSVYMHEVNAATTLLN